jgi:zinc protease
MKIDRVTLENNLNTLFIDSAGSTAATVQIWFRAGSALETKDEQGIAHFLEHMFFKGTKKRPGAKIAHEVESYGGEINAFTSFDYTCYYINTPNDHLDKTVEILLDMVSNPEFKQSELIPERDVVFEEYRRSQDNSGQFNFNQIQKSSFTSGYKHPILGTEKNIKSFSREQLISFRQNNYNLENSLLVIGGDLTKRKKIEKIINKFEMPNGKKSNFPKFKLNAKPTINVHHKEVRQVVLTMVIQAPDYASSSASAEDLALNCLAHGETSELYQNLVVSNSYASGTSGSTMYFANGGAHFLRVVFPCENMKDVLSHLSSTLSAAINGQFNQENINKIKNQYIASKVYEKESLESFSFSLGHGFAQDGNIFCEDDFINRIKATSSTKINNSLSNMFKRNINYTVQIPQTESIDKTKKAIEKFNNGLVKSIKKNKENTEIKFEESKFDKNTKVYNLKNGIKLIHRPNNMTPTFVLHAYLKGGMMYETEQTSGTHYLVGRTLTYGYKGQSSESLKMDLENKSASLGGFSGKNAYGLTLHGQTEHKSSLFKHFFNSFLSPSIPTKFVNLEKELIQRTIDNQKEDPLKSCFKTFNDMIFGDHHYALDMIGTEKSLKKINNKVLKDTHANNLNKSELVITCCGDIDADEVIQMVNKYIKDLKPRKFTKTKIKKIKSSLGNTRKIEFDREQTQIFIGTKGYNILEKEDIYLKMITSHLSGQSSELFVEVRDRQGLCYAVQPIHHAALEAGYWGIYIGAGHDKTKAAINAIMDIINRYSEKGLSKKDFERTKKMMAGNALLNIQTNDDYANIYSIPVLHSVGIDYTNQVNEQISKIKYEEFNTFIKKFFKAKWNVIEVGRS